MDTLSQDQVAEFKEAFKMFADGKDYIDESSLKGAMRQLGMRPDGDEVSEMVEEGDSSGRGRVDFTEFCTMMADRMSGLEPDMLTSAFECFDTHSTGTITHDDMRRVLKDMGPCTFSDKEVRELIKLGDVGDGRLDYLKLSNALTASD
eukprot:TRINITY_DN465_c0_g1_i1.p1 TRINITY_DN465_c0_g1~~TRINITY_DN465_c0_g1_i1.p1  ORF type:complete len:148 (-),score=56.08 TRINITY_DN465_c0_g1_i1:257-700(-)